MSHSAKAPLWDCPPGEGGATSPPRRTWRATRRSSVGCTVLSAMCKSTGLRSDEPWVRILPLVPAGMRSSCDEHCEALAKCEGLLLSMSAKL